VRRTIVQGRDPPRATTPFVPALARRRPRHHVKVSAVDFRILGRVEAHPLVTSTLNAASIDLLAKNQRPEAVAIDASLKNFAPHANLSERMSLVSPQDK
jgi:hypothetical protein